MKDYFGYNSKVCVVTGAASGMGKSLTEMLVDCGAVVYALDISPINVDGIEKAICVDLSKKESIDEAFKLIPNQIDSFFGCAGISGNRFDFTTVVKVNFIANKYITENYLLERMNENGAISYISSGAGSRWEREEYIEQYRNMVYAESWEEAVEDIEKSGRSEYLATFGYMISKRAINYYVPYIMEKFAPKKVRVNGMLPTSSKTGQTDDFAKDAGGMDNLIKYTGFAQRLAEASECAAPMLFLNSDMATYINGELLNVDYGKASRIAAKLQPDPYAQVLTDDIMKMVSMPKNK